MAWRSLIVLAVALGACANDVDGPVDARDASFLMSAKADGSGIEEGSPEACAVMAAANAASAADLDEVAGLDARAVRGITKARPFQSLAALDAVPYVGPVAFERLATFAKDAGYACEGGAGGGGTTEPAECTATGGTYDGVRFTAASECKAVAFLNGARMSDMRAMPDLARRIAYDHCTSGQPCDNYRFGGWTSVAEFAAWPRIAETSVRALASAARDWTAGGPRWDTIKDVWTRRSELSGAPLTFERVYVSRGVFKEEGTFPYYCVEVRDEPGAPNYIDACLQYINADSAPGCTGSPEHCMSVVGQWVWMRGTLRKSSAHPGGYKVNLAPEGPHAANPALLADVSSAGAGPRITSLTAVEGFDTDPYWEEGMDGVTVDWATEGATDCDIAVVSMLGQVLVKREGVGRVGPYFVGEHNSTDPNDPWRPEVDVRLTCRDDAGAVAQKVVRASK